MVRQPPTNTMQNRKIGIIGKGHVGGALARGLATAGYDVRAIGNEPAQIGETARWADLAILAVPYGAIDSVVSSLGDLLDGKTLIDATNALGPNMQLAVGFSTSGAEELQKKLPRAHVVKAFNTVFAQHMDTGKLAGKPLTTFIAGNDPAARKEALEAAGRIGFDGVDVGALNNARLLESLGFLNIHLGYGLGMGTQTGFKYLHGPGKV